MSLVLSFQYADERLISLSTDLWIQDVLPSDLRLSSTVLLSQTLDLSVCGVWLVLPLLSRVALSSSPSIRLEGPYVSVRTNAVMSLSTKEMSSSHDTFWRILLGEVLCRRLAPCDKLITAILLLKSVLR
jgi:hypothetical protein